ncbi:hypothetical protein [Micromonospora pattaloongensis]|uniref:hypothetical protein n=1 Tax=Micromonospora pattaloongensis TaxID=405436 RepID=UPI00111506D7|nr:hypothetical protein [Micromonospora pattaloongensis]
MTNVVPVGTLGGMVWTAQRLDPVRSRRRMELLAEIAGARAARETQQPRRKRGVRLRGLIATRRRLAN